jgi:hydroxymethylglutaryl-CoA lyase
VITIRDVGPRDGLQSEAPVAPAQRAALAVALADAGLRQIEAVSFVSPKAVPSMAGADEVVAALPRRDAVTWWALVPNAKGAELALAAGMRHLTVTVSASEGYSQKNVGRSTDDAVDGLAQIATAANGPALDVVISCCFGSPFGDIGDAAPVIAIVGRTLAIMPGAAVTLADTTGTATPRRVREVVEAVRGQHPDVDLGLHLHDTRGTALANALAGLDLGVHRFDTAVGGLGGSPFAPGAGGNLATEDLVLVADDLGIDTGVDLDALLAVSRSLADLVGHPVPSRVSAAGGLPRFGR